MKGSTGKKIPFDFVLEKLLPLSPEIRPMFGCYAVYINGRLVLALRDHAKHPRDNGVWIATSREFHSTLKQEFLSMRTIVLLGGGKETNWQNLPVDNDHFEEEVDKVCDLILKGDHRIGVVPKKKKTSKAY